MSSSILVVNVSWQAPALYFSGLRFLSAKPWLAVDSGRGQWDVLHFHFAVLGCLYCRPAWQRVSVGSCSQFPQIITLCQGWGTLVMEVMGPRGFRSDVTSGWCECWLVQGLCVDDSHWYYRSLHGEVLDVNNRADTIICTRDHSQWVQNFSMENYSSGTFLRLLWLMSPFLLPKSSHCFIETWKLKLP